jgi:hypothetical protein
MSEVIDIEDSGQRQEFLVDRERREALKKLGKYAAYTAPVMLALLIPKKSLAQSPCPPDECKEE